MTPSQCIATGSMGNNNGLNSHRTGGAGAGSNDLFHSYGVSLFVPYLCIPAHDSEGTAGCHCDSSLGSWQVYLFNSWAFAFNSSLLGASVGMSSIPWLACLLAVCQQLEILHTVRNLRTLALVVIALSLRRTSLLVQGVVRGRRVG